MAKNYFKSYIWLLETLQSRGPLTLNQIKDLWQRSSINEDGKELAPRTFANHVAAIADIFGIDIVCDRRDNTYSIDNEGDLGGNGIRDWLMEALSLNNLINESASLRSRLLFENEPSSHRFLKDIIRAIRDERMLEVNYQSFKMDEPRDFLLEPFCLKEYKRRWYLFARKHGIDNEPHSFALDRMNSVVLSEKPFTVPKSFNAHNFFSTRYGVLQYEGEKPARIKLKVCSRQANYFRTLPLHSSQKEMERNAEYSIFSYYLTPNYDFIHDVLYYGDDVEVLEPNSLRESFSEIITNLNQRYNNMIDRNLKIEYLKRLMFDKYEKKGVTKYFIFQYLRGAGNELNEKFWSEHSSSRMAFELYSGLAQDKAVDEFEFEKQLEGPKSGGMGPNMDVYIETKDEIIFVESKFTEKANLNYINNSYLSPAYWDDAEYGRKKMLLEERLDRRFAKPFADFCREWEEEMIKNGWRKRGTVDWFEPKQETCHLSGILFFLFDKENKDLIAKKKKIRLYNIYWNLGNEGKSDMEKAFVSKANSLIERIISLNNDELNGVNFKLDAFSVQEMLAEPNMLSPHINGFGDDVESRLEQFREAVKNRTRKSFKSNDDLD